MSEEEKKTYVDEADVFYANPMAWIRANMSRSPPQRRRSQQLVNSNSYGYAHDRDRDKRRRDWPDYLIFFSQAEETLTTALRGSGYTECWHGFNSQWHDDWRRRGEVVVWCLFADRKEARTREEAKKGGELRDSVLGGAKGPWGIGRSMSTSTVNTKAVMKKRMVSSWWEELRGADSTVKKKKKKQSSGRDVWS